MKKGVKKIFIILMFSILIFSFSMNLAYGYNWDFKQFDNKVPAGDTAISKIETAGSTVIAVFQVIALGVAILMLVVTGIQYVLAATSDKKAEMKKHMPNYLIGVVFTFAAVGILEIVQQFISKNINP